MKVVIQKETLEKMCWAIEKIYEDVDFVLTDEVKECFDEFETILKDVFYGGQKMISGQDLPVVEYEDEVETLYLQTHENVKNKMEQINLAQTIKMIDDFRRMDK